METQGINIELSLDTGKFKKWLDESRYEFEKMEKRLDSDHYFRLSVNKNLLQENIKQAKELRKVAFAKWDSVAVANIQVDLDKMERELQIAKMKMRNFVNTGDEGVSVLGKMFDKVGEKAGNAIEKMRTDLMKMWKSTKEVDKLQNSLQKLNYEFNNGKKSQAEYYNELGKIEKQMEKMNSGWFWKNISNSRLLAGLGGISFLWNSFEKAKEYGVKKSFRILGKRKNPYPYIAKGTYFCLFSYSEGYGIVIDEAKILKKPVLISDTAAREAVKGYSMSEIFENSEEGIYKGLKEILTNGMKKKKQNDKFTVEEINSNKVYQIIELIDE